VGTSRFQILDCVDVDGSSSGNPYRNTNQSRIFIVEELPDEPVARPPLQRPFASVPATFVSSRLLPPNNCSSFSSGEEEGRERPFVAVSRQTQLNWSLSQMTNTPFFVYQNYSPWSLVEKIITALKTNEGRSNLPSLEGGQIDQKLIERTCENPS
jgi:hypothetical protein